MNSPRPLTFISADWASNKHGGKRSVHVAALQRDGRLHVEHVLPDHYLGQNDSQWNLKGLLRLGAECAESVGPVIIGVDVALGVPSAYLKSWTDKYGGSQAGKFTDWLRSAPEALLKKETKPSTRRYTGPVEWSIGDPFFNLAKNPEPKSPGPGVFTGLADRIGDGLLYRDFDRQTGAQPLWALNKGGSVGSGTRDFWWDLHNELKQPERRFRVWPFEHSDVNPIDSQGFTLAETYPALAYSVVLAPTLDDPPPRMVQIRKTDGRKKVGGRMVRVAHRRREVCERVKGMSWFERASWKDRGKLDDAFDRAHGDEDHFDSLLTALAVVRCGLEEPEQLCCGVDPVAEGGMLLTGAVQPSPARSYENWIEMYGCLK